MPGGHGSQPGSFRHEDTRAGEFPSWLWPGASLLILLAAGFLRLYGYWLKPFHHDEGVNGFFLTRLVREHVYHYDPSNYHGPTLYYFSLLTSLLFGLNDFAVRLVPAIFGVATVWLMLRLRRYIGTIGALTAAALIAVSPCAVFYSRYFIHESLFVFFSVAMVLAALRYYETVNPIYLMLLSVSAAMLFATKETAMITAAVFIIALVSAEVYQRMRGTRGGKARGSKKKQKRFAGQAEPKRGIEATLARFGDASYLFWLTLSAVVLFILVHILFYSSFFTYAKGLSDSLATFKIWVRTGTSEFHAKPWSAYLEWLWQEEAALLLVGIAGVLAASWRATNRFALFAALWTIGIIAAYSLVPYKTPWLVLNFIPPLAIMAGYAVNTLYYAGTGNSTRVPAVALAFALLCFGAYQTVTLNFYHYDDESYPYVYAHTQRGYLTLIDEINRASQRAGTGERTTISIASPDYWPMPWYLRDYKGVAYPGRVGAHTEQIVVCNNSQEAECQAALGQRYRRMGAYPLRSGIMLTLYLRNDVP
ncbi:MAG TPA: flippase activity-associated protein Agl23 [Pyrinomonadaceae bacterium]|nr:flippase activity-associated protein Agl23 [Pyrinomonadaceae bacterium]